jgi:hypothetical protein
VVAFTIRSSSRNSAETCAEMMGRVTASYRFRIEVVDAPGALARVTDVLAVAGGNVESLDLHEPYNGVAIDEIVVSAPDEWDMAVVCASIDALDGVRVLQQRRDRHPGDPIVNALRWARIMVAAGPEEHELELTRAILEVTGASVAWSAPSAVASRTPAGYDALVARSPVIKRTEALPPEIDRSSLPDGFDPPYWLLAVPDDPVDPRLVAFAARPSATPFSRSETARLDALVRLRRSLSTSPGGRSPAFLAGS